MDRDNNNNSGENEVNSLLDHRPRNPASSLVFENIGSSARAPGLNDSPVRQGNN